MKKPFVVIDSIHYTDKGDLKKFGLVDYTIFYSVHLWPKEMRATNKSPATPPTDDHITNLVKDLATSNSPVIYDIEHWPLDIRASVKAAADDDIALGGKKVVGESMEKLGHILSLSKLVNPRLKYGIYGCVPLRDFWAPVKGDQALLEKWKAANDFLQPLADRVDLLCPSLYAFYPNPAEWVVYAKANIEEAKRMAKGKPVFAYLWPKYHNSNKDEGKKFIEGNFWKIQLDTMLGCGIDGVIIWDSRLVVHGPEDSRWDEGRPWWQETLSFMKKIPGK